MTKISNTGAGGLRPTGGPDSTENIQDASKANEPNQTNTSSSPSEVTKSQVAGDKYAAGDLIAAGNQIKAHLDSQLENKTAEAKKTVDPSLSPEELAKALIKGVPHFAPPYVPVGPVVMGDNISAPGQSIPSSKTRQMNLKADQFQINEQGNLVITNEKLIEYFKSLKETGKDLLLGITNLKPPDEE